MRDMRLYFAYGSNMAPSRMKERGIEAKLLGIGYLDHYRFMLNKVSKKDPSVGFANVVPCWTKRVYGVLYDLGNVGKSGILSSDLAVSGIIEKNVKLLDKFEGYPEHYERTTIGIHIHLEGKIRNITSFTYIAELEKQSASNLFVDEKYVEKINEGLDSHEFDKEYKHEIKELMNIWKK